MLLDLRVRGWTPRSPSAASVGCGGRLTTGITVDRLGSGAAQVVRLDGARFGGEVAREPHRHDYHELIWVREGRGRHSLDGRPFRCDRTRSP